MTTALQQGTPEWHAARKGKLTASNVGAALGLCLWTSRKVAFNRAMGTDTFEGNDATRWGSNNEPNAILAYSAHTGNLVEKTSVERRRGTFQPELGYLPWWRLMIRRLMMHTGNF